MVLLAPALSQKEAAVHERARWPPSETEGSWPERRLCSFLTKSILPEWGSFTECPTEGRQCPPKVIKNSPSVFNLRILLKTYLQWKDRLYCKKPAPLWESEDQKPSNMTSQPPLTTYHNGIILIYLFWFLPERTLRGLHRHRIRSNSHSLPENRKDFNDICNVYYLWSLL